MRFRYLVRIYNCATLSWKPPTAQHGDSPWWLCAAKWNWW